MAFLGKVMLLIGPISPPAMSLKYTLCSSADSPTYARTVVGNAGVVEVSTVVSGTVELSSGFGLLVSGLIGVELGCDVVNRLVVVVNCLVVVVNRFVVGEESSGFVVKSGVISGVEVSGLILAVVVSGSTVVSSLLQLYSQSACKFSLHATLSQ